MRVLVTGSRGKVGRAVVGALAARGHVVVSTDMDRPPYDTGADASGPYVRADLTDAAAAPHLVRGVDAVVHAAAIPEPTKDLPHKVFLDNSAAVFHLLQACTDHRVRRVVNLSSISVLGAAFAIRPFELAYCPVDELHPVAPQDPYALSKQVGELLCDAAVRRSDLTCVSIRPSWVLWEGNADRAAAFVGEPGPDTPFSSYVDYVDLYDLADLVTATVESDTPGHEVVNAAAADNLGGRDLAGAVRYHHAHMELRPIDRVDASGISTAKARRLFGWEPRRTWRDYLDDAGGLRLAVPADGPVYRSA